MTTGQLLIACLTILIVATLGLIAGGTIVKDRAAREAFSAAALNAAARALNDASAHLAAPMVALTGMAETLAAATAHPAPPAVGYRVTVHTKQPDDQTLFGLLAADYSDVLVLEDAQYVTPQGGRQLIGAQRIRWADVSWIDVHAHVATADVLTVD
jgi:hypothetical protein